MSSALYAGVVTHARLRPRPHRLRYRLVQGLFDLDALPELSRRLKLFAHNRPGLFSFHDRDHGDGSADLRAWVDGQLAASGLDPEGCEVQILCLPRILGFVFNPLSVYFCRRPDGRLARLIYEVNNTFGERHSYVLPVTEAAAGGPVRQSCGKAFYVSPFMDMGLGYDFTVTPPGEAVAVKVAVSDQEGLLLDAVFAGQRRALTDRALLGLLLSCPLATLQVVAGIHWEALKLWLKGVRLTRKPDPPLSPVSFPTTEAEEGWRPG